MGWAYGVNARGREVGYGVEATCDQEGCDEQIDRGLDYVCGGMHDGGEHGCGHYFCGSHHFYCWRNGAETEQLCAACRKTYQESDDA